VDCSLLTILESLNSNTRATFTGQNVMYQQCKDVCILYQSPAIGEEPPSSSVGDSSPLNVGSIQQPRMILLL